MQYHNELIAALDTLAAERSPLQHPFYQAWTVGTLSMSRLRKYAVQYYMHVAAFPRYLSALHSRCEDLETRQTILENLIDEERGGRNHPELWLRFAAAIGVTRRQVLEARPTASTAELVDTFTRLSRDLPVPAGLAALYVYESQIPAIATAKIEGLRRFYGIVDEESLRFFTVHQEADAEHARAVAALIARHAIGANEQRSAIDGGGAALQAVWNMLDSV